jgi:segregation and condensation protein B
MTRAQVETLAIIAYRQPLTRPEVDEIRGVDSGATMKMLLERELIKILGKKDEPGRPLLYGTTPAFLEFFGLKSLKDLPPLREFTELSEESRRVYEEEMGAEEGGTSVPASAGGTTIDPGPPDAETLATAASFAERGASGEEESVAASAEEPTEAPEEEPTALSEEEAVDDSILRDTSDEETDAAERLDSDE